MTFNQLRHHNESWLEDHDAIADNAPKLAGLLAYKVGETCVLLRDLADEVDVGDDVIARQIADAIIGADLLCSMRGIDLGAAVLRQLDRRPNYGSL